jgi:DNA-binding transcriptional LysR family regulator
VAGLRAEHPGLEIRVEELEPHESLPALRLGEIDVALAHEYDSIPRRPDGAFVEHPLVDDPLRIALPAGHPLAKSATVDLADLAHERWIAGRPGTHCGIVVTTAGRAAGFEPEIAAHASEFPTMLALVAAGLGVAVVPALATAGSAVEGVALVDPRPALHRRIYAAVRPGSGRRAAVAAVLAALATRSAELS